MNTTPSQSEPNPYFLVRFYRWLFTWRGAKGVLLCAAALTTFVALFYVLEDWRGKRAWNKYHQELEAAGFNIDKTSYAPAPVPDDQNFAAIPLWQDLFRYETNPVTKEIKYRGSESRFATNGFTVSLKKPSAGQDVSPLHAAGWDVGAKTDLAEWQTYFRQTNADGVCEFPVSLQPQTPAADVLLAMSRFDPDLKIIRDAAQRPFSRFPVHYEQTFNALLPHLASLKACNSVLQLRSLAELELGQSDQALQDACLSLRLVDSIRNEPFLISHLVRIAMVSISMQPIWEGLADHKWSDSQLATIDRELARLDFFGDFQNSMRGELACKVAALEYMRVTRDSNFGVVDEKGRSTGPGQIEQLVGRMIPSGWFYQNELTAVRLGHDEWFSLVDTNRRQVFPERTSQATINISQKMEQWTPYNCFARLMLPEIEKCLLRFASAQVSIDEARIACALERYRLANSSYPERLAALAPKYLERVPHDIISGQPLIYKRTVNGQFQLYSVGWNGKDDGGKIEYTSRQKVRANLEKSDWIWPSAVDARQANR